jgi:hypothetical protein
LSFEIYHPKNNLHNQDGNHDDNKVRITNFFFELTDNDGQNFLAGIVLFAVLLQKRNQQGLDRIPLLSWQYCLLHQLIPNSRKNEPFIYFSLEYTLDIKK